MNRAAIVVGVLAGVVGALVGGGVDAGLGVLVGGLVGGLGVGLVAWQGRRRVDGLASQVEQWTRPGTDQPSTVVVPDGGPAWVRLGVALNRVGGTFDDQRRRLQHERPWRLGLVDSLVGPALLFDGKARLVAANTAARDMLGLREDDVTISAVQALGSVPLVDAVERARRLGGHVEADADIGDRQVRASVAVVGDETLVILTDRTRERRIEELRRNFVVNASHELKTPATAIQTLSEALEITAARDPERVPYLVGRLRQESERLVRMVHDLLNLRRLEERAEVEAAPVDLVTLTRDVLADMADRASARDVELSLEAPDEAVLQGDTDDVRLVIRNLVANAIQYNREGGRVDVRIVEASSELGAAWSIDVADTGIGIPQQDLQRIFERFYRVDVARSRETGGTGLGLAIVRHAVERHHGTIRVDSLLGQGTTFTVTLPARPPD